MKPIAGRAVVLREACASNADEGVRWPKFWSGDGKNAPLDSTNVVRITVRSTADLGSSGIDGWQQNAAYESLGM